jgi:hypothetical protein
MTDRPVERRDPMPGAGSGVGSGDDITPVAPADAPAGPAPDAAPAGTDAAPRAAGRLGRRWWVAGIAIAILVVVLLAPRASSDPDGLNRVATDNGFIGQAENVFSGVLGGYRIPGIGDPAVSTIVSGLLGLAIILGLVFLIGRVLARRKA